MRLRSWRLSRQFRSSLSSASSGEEAGPGYVYQGGYWIARDNQDPAADRYYTMGTNQDFIGTLEECENWLWYKLAKIELHGKKARRM